MSANTPRSRKISPQAGYVLSGRLQNSIAPAQCIYEQSGYPRTFVFEISAANRLLRQTKLQKSKAVYRRSSISVNRVIG
jgi:hypothetical protein